MLFVNAQRSLRCGFFPILRGGTQRLRHLAEIQLHDLGSSTGSIEEQTTPIDAVAIRDLDLLIQSSLERCLVRGGPVEQECVIRKSLLVS